MAAGALPLVVRTRALSAVIWARESPKNSRGARSRRGVENNYDDVAVHAEVNLKKTISAAISTCFGGSWERVASTRCACRLEI